MSAIPLFNNVTLTQSPANNVPLYMFNGGQEATPVQSNFSTKPLMGEIPTAENGWTDGLSGYTADPFAQWGGKAAYDSQVGEINSDKQNVFNTANASLTSGFNTGRGNILDFIDGAKTAQNTIDTRRQNAMFSQLQGADDITQMVGRGIQSGNVMLANKNASSSGAAGQIARAYGELGNREMQDVNNQFELENQSIKTDEGAIATGFETQKRKVDEFKTATMDSIVNTARNDLQVLESRRIGASLPELFQIDQEASRIRGEAAAKLGELDTLLAAERAKINPMDAKNVRAKAYQMKESGRGGPQMFDFNTQAAPIQASGRSIAGSNVPVYSNVVSKRKEV